jgi:DNA-directed RNA polymerase subunit RPC12/RpoP
MNERASIPNKTSAAGGASLSNDGLERCPNCGSEHENEPNWYCAKCSDRFQRLTGKGFLDGNGLHSNIEERRP